jgi:hypothetical protein
MHPCTGPIVIFLMKHLKLSGCEVPFDNIRCDPCTATRAGSFSPEAGAIQMCAGNFISKQHSESTMAHELIHMYDHCKFKVDWSNLRHHACSEVSVNMLPSSPSLTSLDSIDSRQHPEWRLPYVSGGAKRILRIYRTHEGTILFF